MREHEDDVDSNLINLSFGVEVNSWFVWWTWRVELKIFKFPFPVPL